MSSVFLRYFTLHPTQHDELSYLSWVQSQLGIEPPQTNLTSHDVDSIVTVMRNHGNNFSFLKINAFRTLLVIKSLYGSTLRKSLGPLLHLQVGTIEKMLCFDSLLFTHKYWRANQI